MSFPPAPPPPAPPLSLTAPGRLPPPEELRLDPAVATTQIVAAIRVQVAELGRRGVVLGMSGGIDSSVTAALAARAFGPTRVLGLFLPDAESDPESLVTARAVADSLGVSHQREDITPALTALGCYARRDAVIRTLVPGYGPGWGCKVCLSSRRLDSESLAVPLLAVQPPGGPVQRLRLPAAAYRELIAATNFKQRVRKTLEYFHADRLHYAVLGTPNRLEYDQGFFVKGGDGLADLKPIAHLYKSQVYQLGEHLGLPDAILRREPTTDTWSLPQSQEEFFFGVPVAVLDRLLHAFALGHPPAAAAERLGLTVAQVERVFRDIRQKRAATRHLHLPAFLVSPVPFDGPAGRAG